MDRNPAHDALLADLDALSRKHLLFFRIEAGRTVARHLYGGDPVVMREALAHRDGALRAFAQARAEELKDRGLSEQLLRHALAAWDVVTALPGPIVDQLQYTHVVELSRLEDVQAREHLALATVNNRWSSDQLIEAIRAVGRGQWIDADPSVAGMQPPTPPAPPAATPTRSPTPGRWLQTFERSAKDVAETLGAFEPARAKDLTPIQKERAREALGLLMERARALLAELD